MSKSPQSRKLSIAGPAGELESILEVPGDTAPDGAVVVCHPHPQHGGTMHNKVAHTLARSFVRAGFAALRFNFRGTEGSEGEYDDGVGELDDALAAPAIYRFADGLDRQPQCPWLVVQGDEDELVEVDETISWFNGLDPGPELLIIPGAEHFFHGRLNDLREAVMSFIVDAKSGP